MSKQTAKIITSGRLTMPTRPKPNFREKPCSKLILYMTPADLHVVEYAIKAVERADLVGVDPSGTPNGRAVVAICRQWLKGRAK